MRNKNIKLVPGNTYSKDYFRENISYQLFGINTFKKSNNIVIITGAKGSSYDDEWNKDTTTINYIGKGRSGNQDATKGVNGALLYSSLDTSLKVIHMFDAIPELMSYKYLGIFHLIGEPFYRDSLGQDHIQRKEIVFPLGRKNKHNGLQGGGYIYATENETILNQIDSDKSIDPTTKSALRESRIGQGKYKKRLEKIEKKCRFTGVGDSLYLIASHIKPWRSSNNYERLDGCNGLLLSPNYDKLFDRGYISIKNNGDLIVSNHLSKQVINLWSVDVNYNVGNFSSEQKKYLAHHRKYVFESFIKSK